jgi:hypothetical protein
MKPPPSNISMRSDFEGHRILSWQAMHPVLARVIAALLLIVASSLWALFYKFPLTLWGLLQEKEPDWLGMAVMVSGSAFLIIPTMAAVIAFHMVFRPEPESITLEPGRLVYKPGSAIMGFDSNMFYRPALLWGIIRGKAQIKIAREDFHIAKVIARDRTEAVELRLKGRLLHIGRWLGRSEQLWLAETLMEWKSGI